MAFAYPTKPRFPFSSSSLQPCGCYFYPGTSRGKTFLPQIGLSARTTVWSTVSQTLLSQTFINPSPDDRIDQAVYQFPLYDGVSVVGFTCCIGSRTISGVVKEKGRARTEYKEAVDRGETAGLLEQSSDASDVWSTRIGNIPTNEKVVVEITYLGELKHDAEKDAHRFTIPTAIAPRYGNSSYDEGGLPKSQSHPYNIGGIEIVVDVAVDDGCLLRGIQSPSHPIGISMGRTSTMPEDSIDPRRASATLALGDAALNLDFVLLILTKDQGAPRALLETHPRISGQRALMATLVPKFNLPLDRPEIVFVADRSGSMRDKIPTLKSALKVFLKSLPVGVKFNICSFGSGCSTLWTRSQAYNQASLDEAIRHVDSFAANMGGTELLSPVKVAVEGRFQDLNLEVMLLTDGQINNQQALFDYINETTQGGRVRMFSVGIGNAASHSLIEGIARAGNGFAQSVMGGEQLDRKIVRMLKGALTPHVNNYTLEIKYESEAGDDFDMVEKVGDGTQHDINEGIPMNLEKEATKGTISLFDQTSKEQNIQPTQEDQDPYKHLPSLEPPKLLQAPHTIPPLYPFIRSTVYVLMSPETLQKFPVEVVLRGTSKHGPLELSIPIQDIGQGEMINRLAAKKAMLEIEEGRGWIQEVKNKQQDLIKEKYESKWDEMVQRAAVDIGVKYQVAGKWCSFVAVQRKFAPNAKASESLETSSTSSTLDFDDADIIDEVVETPPAPQAPASGRGNAVGGAMRHRKIISKGPRTSTGGMAPRKQMASQAAPQPHQTMEQPPGTFGTQSVGSVRGGALNSTSSVGGAFGQAAPDRLTTNLDASAATPQSNTFGGSSMFQNSKKKRISHAQESPSPLFTPSPSSFATTTTPKDFRVASFGQQSNQQPNTQSTTKPQEAPIPRSDEDRAHALIELQLFNGAWTRSKRLFQILQMDEKIVEQRIGTDDRALTALAVIFFDWRLKAHEESWELVVEKAKGWLEEQGVVEGGELWTRVFEDVHGGRVQCDVEMLE